MEKVEGWRNGEDEVESEGISKMKWEMSLYEARFGFGWSWECFLCVCECLAERYKGKMYVCGQKGYKGKYVKKCMKWR